MARRSGGFAERRTWIFLAWLILLAHGSRAQTVDHSERLRARDGQRTGLYLRAPGDGPQDYRAATELATSIRLTITGPIVRASVDQRFANPEREPVEAVYLFPLPEGAAVDTFELRAGEERLVGEVRERAQARREYEAAKSEGRRTSLLEQHRPNLFTVSIAGIGAGEEVTVHLEFQDFARYDAGAFRLRLPLTVGPRYEPAAAPTSGGESGRTAAPSEPLPPQAMSAAIQRPVDFRAELDAGVPLAAIESASHRLVVRRLGGRRAEIRLAAKVTAADRDLELSWRPREGAAPELARFEETAGGEPYVALLFLPPAAAAPALPTPRELVVVLDTSGSMEGTSIAQARRAVRFALERLAPWDRFQVIRFSDAAERFFPESREASTSAITEAADWVESLSAGGGTNIAAALDLALEDGRSSSLLRQILFVTDGCVGNESAIFERLAARLGESRLFTVGIGSAPNGYFLQRAAEIGRGSFTFVSRADQVEERMGALFVKLERPALVDLALAWDDPVAESYPARLPDLYAGEPLLVVSRLARGDAGATLSGERGGSPFLATLPAGPPSGAVGIARLWARRKIDALEAAEREPGADPAALRAARVAIALEHRLLTRETSFVAVAPAPSRDSGGALARRDVATLRPAGWTMGDLPQGGTRAPIELLSAIVLAALAFALRRFGAAR